MVRQLETAAWQKGLAFAVLGTVLWGLAPVATKSALRALDPDTLAFLRLAVASFVFRFVGGKTLLAGLGSPWAWIAGAALAGDFLLYTRALLLTSASAAALLVCVEPVATIALAVWLLGERWNRQRLWGSVLTLAGVAVVAMQGGVPSGAATTAAWRGNALIVAAALLWSVYAVAQRKTLTDSNWASRLHAIFFVGALCTLPFAAAHPQVDVQAPVGSWFAAIVLVLLCTAGVYLVYARAQRLLDVSVLSLLLAGIPVFGVAFARLLLSEPLPVCMLGGTLFVVGGAVVLALEPAPGPSKELHAGTPARCAEPPRFGRV